MRRAHGFTLIELAIVLGVIGIVGSLGFASMRASRKNATVASAAFALQMRIEQLQYVALSEQAEQLLVVVDVPDNDARLCGTVFDAGCARLFHLREPTSAWKLSDFDVDSPGANVARIVDEDRLGQGIKFHLGAASAALPVPFDAYGSSFRVFDGDLTPTCADSRRCVAFRFRPNGKVVAEPPDPASPPSAVKNGHAFALGSDLTGVSGGARQVAVLVATPSGIVRTFAVP